MKRYIVNLSLFATILIAIFLFAIGGRFVVSHKINWKADPVIKIAFMGASHITRGIDVNDIRWATNLSKPSERYMFTYLKLKHLLAANDSIDTIVLQCAPTDVWLNTDDKYFAENEISEFIPLFYPLFGKEEWKAFYGHYISLFNHIALHAFDQSLFYEDQYLERIGLNQKVEIPLEEMDAKSVHKDLFTGKYGDKINIEYLHKIISLCETYKRKLYLLYCPVYKPEFYYDQDYYYTVISKLKKNRNVTYLDYSHFNLPDSCRYDAHHLNAKGAKLFTTEILREINRKE